jgi:type VI protein secretion system component VasF
MDKGQINWQIVALLLAVIFLLIFIGFAITIKGESQSLIGKMGDSLKNLI